MADQDKKATGGVPEVCVIMDPKTQRRWRLVAIVPCAAMKRRIVEDAE
jgi:hypothetical protein